VPPANDVLLVPDWNPNIISVGDVESNLYQNESVNAAEALAGFVVIV
jgi:hypothetical protein